MSWTVVAVRQPGREGVSSFRTLNPNERHRGSCQKFIARDVIDRHCFAISSIQGGLHGFKESRNTLDPQAGATLSSRRRVAFSRPLSLFRLCT